jgi:hypothetical protein
MVLQEEAGHLREGSVMPPLRVRAPDTLAVAKATGRREVRRW